MLELRVPSARAGLRLSVAGEDSVTTVQGGCAQHAPGATLQTVVPGAMLELSDVADRCP